MKDLKLKQLIYGLNNTILISSTDYKTILEEIDLIRSGSTIEGFIFRPNFAKDKTMTEYTDEDWAAMFAQYSITYGWENKYAEIEGRAASQVLENYFLEAGNDDPYEIPTSDKTFKIDSHISAMYLKLAKSFVESKIVLRTHQLEILALLPLDVIEEAYKKYTFVIKETEIHFAKLLVQAGSKIQLFNDPQQIVRFIVACYSDFTDTGVQLNKSIVKNIKLKIPTSARKQILNSLNNMKGYNAVQRMKPMKEFWKRIFMQLAYTDLRRLTRRYPVAYNIRDILHNTTIKTNATDIEAEKRRGNLAGAFRLEMKNPGQMVRSLLFYLRYTTGMEYAKKQEKSSRPSRNVSDIFEGKGTKPKGVVKVLTDISNIINDDVFRDTLEKTNTKLLWQIVDMLNDPKWADEKRSRICNKTEIYYSTSRPLPGINADLAEKVRKIAKKAIKTIKKEENKKLGKVYIDKACKDYKIQLTGREDSSISLTGEYMAPGSKISIKEALKKAKNPIIRMGIAWRGQSCDVDLSTNINDRSAVYYGNPSLSNGKDVVISSSGDITGCGKDKFSVEFIDIDYDKLPAMDINKLVSSAIVFSGPTFADIECYWFITILPQEKRVIRGSSVQISLDEMHYAAKLQSESKVQLGLMVDVDKDEIEVLNFSTNSTRNFHNARMNDDLFNSMIADRPVMSTVYKVLKNTIAKDQLVDSPLEADLIISPNDLQPEDIKVLHPGKDQTDMMSIYF